MATCPTGYIEERIVRAIIANPSWKKEILANLLKKLYRPLFHKLEIEQEKILFNFRRYKDIPDWDNVTIYYKGRRYQSMAVMDGICKDRYIDLDPKFWHSMDENLEEEVDLENERIIIQSFLRRMMNICISKHDIASILPGSLYKPLLNSTPDLSPKTRKKFLAENSIHLETIKQRMVHNLLIK